MKNLCLFLFILISSISLEASLKKQKKYGLAICAITRNDAPYLKEWVNFHLHQGVEHIYIYDNLSEDHPEIALKDYIKKGFVEIIKWDVDHKTRKEWLSCQTGAYTHCAKARKNTVKWCAFLDTDEFLFCPSGQKIPDFLKQFSTYDQLAVSWLIFGTSNVQKAQPGKLAQELLFRNEVDKSHNCKSIVRLQQAIECPNPHFFITKNMHMLVDPNKQQITPRQFNKAPYGIDKLRIHHYMFRDLDFFLNTKLARLKQQGKDTIYYIEFEKLFNKVRDDSILKCLPKK